MFDVNNPCSLLPPLFRPLVRTRDMNLLPDGDGMAEDVAWLLCTT